MKYFELLKVFRYTHSSNITALCHLIIGKIIRFYKIAAF